MAVQRVQVSEAIEIAYEEFGDPADPAVVLVMGLGAQMVAWPDELCADLAGRGLRVVRFDNRDVGESTHLDGVRPPSLRRLLDPRTPPPYRVHDMALDTLGLLDALGLDRVHLVGASMGGFIAQAFALHAPQRLHTLTLIMTSTGSRLVGQADVAFLRQLLRGRAAGSRDEALDMAVEVFRMIGSPGYPFDEQRVRELAGRSYDRAYDRDGYRRQLAAVNAQPDRTKRLRGLRVPTLVVHGLADRLVKPSGGLALARAIPGARFVGHSGMGHDLPRPLWPELADDVAGLARRARQEAVPA